MTVQTNRRFGQAEILALWESGTPLRDAPVRYGKPELVKRYQATWQKNVGLTTIVNAVAEMVGAPDALPAEIRTTNAERTEFIDLCRKLDDDFCARLIHGEFLAFGYAYPRDVGDLPVLVPSDLFPFGRLDIAGGKATGEGLRIEAIRVVHLEWMDALVQPKAPPGRPSKRATIQAAYDACQSINIIDYGAPQLRCIEQIRAWIKVHKPDDFGDGKGFGVEAIRNVISKDFAARATHRKL
jgi:hypothetical protein